jgi:hypothetical protein
MAHPAAGGGGLGTGWRTALDVLGRAASDGSGAVVAKAAAGLRTVSRALFVPGGAGHGYLAETVRAAAAGARNKAATLQTNAACVGVLETCGRQLATLGKAGAMAYSGPGACVAAVGSESGAAAAAAEAAAGMFGGAELAEELAERMPLPLESMCFLWFSVQYQRGL